MRVRSKIFEVWRLVNPAAAMVGWETLAQAIDTRPGNELRFVAPISVKHTNHFSAFLLHYMAMDGAVCSQSELALIAVQRDRYGNKERQLPSKAKLGERTLCRRRTCMHNALTASGFQIVQAIGVSAQKQK